MRIVSAIAVVATATIAIADSMCFGQWIPDRAWGPFPPAHVRQRQQRDMQRYQEAQQQEGAQDQPADEEDDGDSGLLACDGTAIPGRIAGFGSVTFNVEYKNGRLYVDNVDTLRMSDVNQRAIITMLKANGFSTLSLDFGDGGRKVSCIAVAVANGATTKMVPVYYLAPDQAAAFLKQFAFTARKHINANRAPRKAGIDGDESKKTNEVAFHSVSCPFCGGMTTHRAARDTRNGKAYSCVVCNKNFAVYAKRGNEALEGVPGSITVNTPFSTEKCPHCGSTASRTVTHDTMHGKAYRCAMCNTGFLVPSR